MENQENRRPAAGQPVVSAPPPSSRHFLITIDTEEEFDWDGPFRREGHTTVSTNKLERFQLFIEKYGVKPVYYIDYSIVEDDAAAAFLSSAWSGGNADIGVHMHPWVNPPFDEQLSERNSFAGNLPLALEREKILRLLDRMETRLGNRSDIYRAGRYGVGKNTPEILTELGFCIDSSVRPGFDYSGEGGPDFSHAPNQPYWLDDAKSLLEVPLTTVFSGMLRKQSRWLSKMSRGSELTNAILSRTKILERIPLTPEGVTEWEAKEAIDVALDDGLELLVFSFHSPSLSVGHTPYVQSERDLDAFYDWWRAILEHLQDRGVAPTAIHSVRDRIGSR